MGAPGVGKSAVAAISPFTDAKSSPSRSATGSNRATETRSKSSAPSPFNSPPGCPTTASSCSPCRKSPDWTRKNAAELFDYLLADPLHHVIDGGRERCLIVIDALGEADEAGEAGSNPLVRMLTDNVSKLTPAIERALEIDVLVVDAIRLLVQQGLEEPTKWFRLDNHPHLQSHSIPPPNLMSYRELTCELIVGGAV